uniref:EF-hand domain-containing protein n=1 Tax=Periophthalmus magnuspinnatus TaxID=409849 RepID=A0A3B4BKG7_9GOBI
LVFHLPVLVSHPVPVGSAGPDLVVPYLEQHRVDHAHFSQLITELSPWRWNSHTHNMAARLFRLQDQNQDGLVNFKEFIYPLSKTTVMYHGDLTEKLKLLYKLHLPPGKEGLILLMGSYQCESAPISEVASYIYSEKVKDYRFYLRQWAKENEPRRESIKDLPRMNQEQFIELCKTLYCMFSEDSCEQQLYHSIATVASLLLRIGEVAKRFTNHASKPADSASDPTEPAPSSTSPQGRTADADWSISFEQVLASLLTETPLVDFFERKALLRDKMANHLDHFNPGIYNLY